jgi:hypothetical protein
MGTQSNPATIGILMHFGHDTFPSSQVEQPTGPPRLLVNFKLEDIDALDIIPAILRPYASRLLLTSSNLQASLCHYTY